MSLVNDDGTQTKRLDVPDGLEVSEVHGDKSSLRFYTGRFAVDYDVDDVRELIRVLQTWVEQ